MSEKEELQRVIDQMKDADAKYAKFFKRFQIIYWCMVILGVASLVFLFFYGFSKKEMVGMALNLLALLMFAVVFTQRSRTHSTQNYSLTLMEMLHQAKKRYSFFKNDMWLLTFPIALIGISTCVIDKMSPISFVIVLCVAILAGYLGWVIKDKPLRDRINKMIVELENEER